MYSNPVQQKCSDSYLWLKRLGWLGFLIFLVKGVVWLTLPMLFALVGAAA